MRPRHKAAENGVLNAIADWLESDASMRPRHKAAENHASRMALSAATICFNEAAA